MAIEELGKAKNTSARSEEDILSAQKDFPAKNSTKIKTALFYDPQKIPKEATDFFNIIYIPLEKYDKRPCDGLGVMLPEVIFDGQADHIESLLKKAYEQGARDALVGNVGHIALAKKYGFTVHGDTRFNVTNNSSLAVLEDLGVEDCILSPELTLPQIRDIGGNRGVCVYGRLPLMLTEKCVGSEIGGCKPCEEGRLSLTDRRGVRFPVIKRYPHRSLVFNSLPIYMADRTDDLRRAKIEFEHFIFSVESLSEVCSVINSYKNRLPAPDKCKRIK